MNAKHIVGSAALAVATALSGMAAQAEDGVWRVGNSFVIRHAGLDLETPEGRQALLDMIETAAQRACRNEATRARRSACAQSAVERALAEQAPAVQQAVAEARQDRNEQAEKRLWAQR